MLWVEPTALGLSGLSQQMKAVGLEMVEWPVMGMYGAATVLPKKKVHIAEVLPLVARLVGIVWICNPLSVPSSFSPF
jgi:hypothetical protein